MTRPTATPLAFAALLATTACDNPTEPAVASALPGLEARVVAESDIVAGRYLVQLGGCNDCHTPNFARSGGQTPEAEWLMGNGVGFRGPWGVSYAANLRMTVAATSEDEWVEMLETRQGLPPMPWPSVRAMSEPDQRALHRYIRSLGPGGEAAPTALPPDVEPTTPYEDFTTVMPKPAA